MHFTKLGLDNFGVHRHLELDLAPGLTGLVGSNGSGKSTILAALEYLVTGDCPLQGTSDENIHTLAGAKELSQVSGTLLHAGHRLEIVRDLRRSAKSSVAVDGGEAVYGVTKVNAAIAECLGHDIPPVEEYVFVKQGRISEFLSATAAKRAEAYAGLFGTRQAETCYKLIQKRLNGIRVPGEQTALDDIRRRVGDGREEIIRLKKELAAYDDLADTAVTTQDQDLLRRDKLAKDAVVERGRCVTALTELNQFTIDDEALRERVATDIAARESRLEALRDQHTSDIQARLLWTQYDTSQRDVSRVQSRRDAVTRDEKIHPEPEWTHDKYIKNKEGYEEKTRELDRGVEAAREYLARFQRDGVTECSQCGTPVSALLGSLEQKTAIFTRDLPVVEDRQRWWKQSRNYDVVIQVWEKWRNTHAITVADIVLEESRLSEAAVAAPSEPRVVTDLTVTIIKEEKSIAVCKKQFQDITNTLSTAEGRKLGLVEEGKRQRAITRANELDADLVRRAQSRLEIREERIGESGVLLGKLNTKKSTVRDDVVLLTRLEQEANNAATVRASIAKLELVQAVLQRDALPRAIAITYLELAIGDVNELLELFDAPFRVSAAEDLSLVARFHGGIIQPARRLSGGQKVILALAMRVAVNSLFAGSLGLLVLDEPTEFLDEKNIDCLSTALLRLRTLSAEREMQIILVTHEKRLAPLFDCVIELPAILAA